MRNRTVAVLLGLVLALAACGDDGAEEPTTTTTDRLTTTTAGGHGAHRLGRGPSSLNPGLGELTEDYPSTS